MERLRTYTVITVNSPCVSYGEKVPQLNKVFVSSFQQQFASPNKTGWLASTLHSETGFSTKVSFGWSWTICSRLCCKTKMRAYDLYRQISHHGGRQVSRCLYLYPVLFDCWLQFFGRCENSFGSSRFNVTKSAHVCRQSTRRTPEEHCLQCNLLRASFLFELLISHQKLSHVTNKRQPKSWEL